MNKKTKKNTSYKARGCILLAVLIVSVMSILPIISASEWTSDLDDGLTHYWNFNESSGTNAEDIRGADIGNQYNFTLSGTTSFTSGIIGNALTCETDGQGVTSGGTAGFPSGTGAWTMNFWVKTSDNYGTLLDMGTTALYLRHEGVSGTRTYVGATDLGSFGSSLTDWQMITYRKVDGGSLYIYINGTQQKTGSPGSITPANIQLCNNWVSDPYLDGQVDELSFWNRTISTDEITQLYNGGTGITYFRDSSSLNIETILSSPANDTDFFSITEKNFYTNHTISGGNLTNATLYVWEPDGTLLGTDFTLISGNSINTTNLSMGGLTTGNGYEWNTLTCGQNSTDTSCVFADNNYTFSVVPFQVNSQYFVNNPLETSRQYFNISIDTLETVLSISSSLNYNGTQHMAQTDCSSGTCFSEINIDIPPVINGESQNKSFNWQITVFDGVTSYSFDIDSLEQNVSRIHLEACNTTYPTKVINFTAYDEQNLTRIKPFKFAGTFEYWLGGGTEKRNLSINENSVNSQALCIFPNRTYYHTSQIAYAYEDENLTYVPRDYYFQNATLSNISQDFSLYLLLNSESTTFIEQAQDETLGAISDVLILTQRYYPGEGIFRTVQVGKTDANGKTVGFFEAETADYKFIGIKNGEVLFTQGPKKVFGESVPYTLTFQILNNIGTPWSYYEGLGNLVTNLSYNENLKMVYFTFVDTSGSLSSARLVVENQNPLGSNTIICNTSTILASATITCNVTNYNGTIIAKSYIGRSPEVLTDLINILVDTAIETFGRLGLFLGTLAIMAGYAVAAFSISAGLLVGLVITILLNLTPLLSLPGIFIFAQIALTIIVLVAVNKR